MPYRKFVEVSVHVNRGSSPSAKERAVEILQQWIARHGPFKAIAELQVLSTYPYLAREILGSWFKCDWRRFQLPTSHEITVY